MQFLLPGVLIGLGIGYIDQQKKRLRNFDEEYKKLSDRYFTNRSTSQKLNLTYLYMYDHEKFNKLMKDELNECHEKYKDSKLASTTYNTPLACTDCAREVTSLVTLDRQNDRKYIRGWTPQISQNDVDHDIYSYEEFVRGCYVADPDYMPHKISKTDHQKNLERAVEDKKVYQKQLEEVNEKRMKEVELVREIKESPLLYNYLSYFYPTKKT
jgi:hypothetical protein